MNVIPERCESCPVVSFYLKEDARLQQDIRKKEHFVEHREERILGMIASVHAASSNVEEWKHGLAQNALELVDFIKQNPGTESMQVGEYLDKMYGMGAAEQTASLLDNPSILAESLALSVKQNLEIIERLEASADSNLPEAMRLIDEVSEKTESERTHVKDLESQQQANQQRLERTLAGCENGAQSRKLFFIRNKRCGSSEI